MKKILLSVFLLLNFSPLNVAAQNGDLKNHLGISREELVDRFGFENIRTYQDFENIGSITFDYPLEDRAGAITFYLEDNIVEEYTFNDREEMAKQYMSEFASGNILFNYPKIRIALLSALIRLPLDFYLEVTDRRRPLIFIDYYTAGIAQYAGSLEFTMRETDPPTFQNGFYLIRLGDGLNDAKNPQAIEGVILHEIIHRKLEHLKVKDRHPCELEMEANQLLKKLGFGDSHAKASETFGAKQKGDSPCHDILLKLKEEREKKSD